MTQEAQRIALAEFCGWKWNETAIWHPDYERKFNRHRHFYHPERVEDMMSRILPDYLHDLNAMTEAIGNLKGHHQRIDFVNILWVVVNPLLEWDTAKTDPDFLNYVNATAAQRAEALLKCLGKWQEDA